jgi:hypothetical protein
MMSAHLRIIRPAVVALVACAPAECWNLLTNSK